MSQLLGELIEERAQERRAPRGLGASGLGLHRVGQAQELFEEVVHRERTIVDEQYWKYNQETQRWLLHSGLPDPTQGR